MLVNVFLEYTVEVLEIYGIDNRAVFEMKTTNTLASWAQMYYYQEGSKGCFGGWYLSLDI